MTANHTIQFDEWKNAICHGRHEEGRAATRRYVTYLSGLPLSEKTVQYTAVLTYALAYYTDNAGSRCHALHIYDLLSLTDVYTHARLPQNTSAYQLARLVTAKARLLYAHGLGTGQPIGHKTESAIVRYVACYSGMEMPPGARADFIQRAGSLLMPGHWDTITSLYDVTALRNKAFMHLVQELPDGLFVPTTTVTEERLLPEDLLP